MTSINYKSLTGRTVPSLSYNCYKILGSDMVNHRRLYRVLWNTTAFHNYFKVPTLISVLCPLCKPWTTEQCGFGICWAWPCFQPMFTYASLQCQHFTLHQFCKYSEEFSVNLNSFYCWSPFFLHVLFFPCNMTDLQWELQPNTSQKTLTDISFPPLIF